MTFHELVKLLVKKETSFCIPLQQSQSSLVTPAQQISRKLSHE